MTEPAFVRDSEDTIIVRRTRCTWLLIERYDLLTGLSFGRMDELKRVKSKEAPTVELGTTFSESSSV